MREPFRSGRNIALLCLLAVATDSQAADFADFFLDRQTVLTAAGEVFGSNVGASVEPEEPEHGGKKGGHSLWISWIAPTNGIVRFTTAGSGFDTLLSAYLLEPGDKPPMERLQEVAKDDDDEESSGTNSVIEFGAVAGRRYEVAIDGYQGATGPARLAWSFSALSQSPPVILSVPGDRAAQLGDTLTLSVNLQSTVDLEFRWFLNSEEVDDAESPTLTLTNLQPAQLGQYRLRIIAENIRFFTQPVELQVNSEGLTNALARNKVPDSLESILEDPDPSAPVVEATNIPLPRLNGPIPLPPEVGPIGVVRGYSGIQIFNTTYATRDPAEPLHCGVAGGTSYWLAWAPPTNGLARLDTAGSTYDTILAVYTFNPPLSGYEGLIPVACDDDSGPNGMTSALEFQTEAGRTYLVVLDGVNGALGIAYLHYDLTPSVPQPPVLIRGPVPATVAAGGGVRFTVAAGGSPPLTYRWFRSGYGPLPDQSGPVLDLPRVTPLHAGSYWVSISNLVGSLYTPPAALRVLAPPTLTIDRSQSTALLTFQAVGGSPCVVEFADNPASLWTPLTTNTPGTDGELILTQPIPSSGIRFFRIHYP